jgi:hypothetical protein
MMEAIISVTLKHNDGRVISRTVTVSPPYYGYEPKYKFKQRARRQAIGALNSVLGTPKELRITDATE